MTTPLRAALARLELFASASEADLDAVMALAVERRYAEGETLFLRGDVGEGMIVVLQGRIRLSIVSAEGRELILREAEAGDVIGEIAVIDGGRRTADAVAAAPVVAGFIGQPPFTRLLAERPGLHMPILQVMCARLRETTDQLESIALYPIEVRLARFLLIALKGESGQGGKRVPLELGFSQGELAQLLGASRPKVNIALGFLEEAGAIGRTSDRLFCDPAILARIAEKTDG